MELVRRLQISGEFYATELGFLVVCEFSQSAPSKPFIWYELFQIVAFETEPRIWLLGDQRSSVSLPLFYETPGQHGRIDTYDCPSMFCPRAPVAPWRCQYWCDTADAGIQVDGPFT
jgi:hypothetical protein